MIESAVYSVTPGAQAGYVLMSNVLDPAIWSGTSASLFRVQTPSLPFGGTGKGISGSQLVGDNSSPLHAFVYDKVSQAVTDLHPTGAFASKARAVASGQQVGLAQYGGMSRAAMWHGTPQSYIDLHPAGASWSIAQATTGALQGGDASIGTTIVAGIWSGTAASFVNLNPVHLGGTVGSELRGMGGDQQVGTVFRAGNPYHAALWRGSAASFIDLNPADALASQAYGTDGAAQVGIAYYNDGADAATIWFGSAGTAHRLDQYLPPGYRASIAYSVVNEGDRIVVGGVAMPNGSERTEAFLWVYIPAPGTAVALCIPALLAARRRR